MKIIRRLPMETYAYYEIEFDNLEEYKQNYKAIRKEINEQERPESKPVEVKVEGNFIKKI